MIDLENFITSLQVPDELSSQIKGKETVSFYDVCRRTNITDEIVVEYAAEGCKIDDYYCIPDVEEKCKTSSRPIDFIYDRKTDSFDLSKYRTDMDLVAKIQTGKGDETFMYYGHKNIYVELIFAGTTPAEVTQDYVNGNNDLYSARTARWAYTLDNKLLSEGYSVQWGIDFDVFV
jgi:hypothetical protein